MEHALAPENRSRFASLAVLYGWTYASDHQVIYENDPPHFVHSVDHGHFFYGGPDWIPAILAAAPPAVADQRIVTECALTNVDIEGSLRQVAGTSEGDIATAVAMPLDQWGMTLDDRVALAEYLWRRRAELSAAIVPNA